MIASNGSVKAFLVLNSLNPFTMSPYHRSIACAAFLLAILLHGCNNDQPSTQTSAQVQKPIDTILNKPLPNIILFIGDGTGLSQLSSLWYMGKPDEEPNYARFTYTGISKTNSSSHRITDSGAGATAFSIGEKTYNGAIGVDRDSVSKKLITQYLAEKGYRIGLVSTSSITHATPASFYAHSKSRNLEDAIASQMCSAPLQFFAGGGRQFFNKRRDSLPYIDSLKKHGFIVDTQALTEYPNADKVGYLLADDGMPRITEGRKDFLPKATSMAIQHLSKDDAPFFLVVEGSQVDWGGHANDSAFVITELVDLDNAIGVAQDYAELQQNTLVVALADHETGGYSLPGRNIKTFGGKTRNDYDDVTVRFTSDGHTCAHIPVFALGIGAEAFTGIYENHTVFQKLLGIAGISPDGQ